MEDVKDCVAQFVPGALTNAYEFIPIILYSIVAYALIYNASKVLSPIIFSKIFSRLDGVENHLWHMRTVSTVHALVTGTAGIFSLKDYDLINEDPCNSWSSFIGLVVAQFVGYSIMDTGLLFLYYEVRGRPWDIVLHHAVVSALAVIPILYQAHGMIVSLYLINELSTPFLNLMQMMKTAGIHKNASIVVINQVIFGVVFFFCRVVPNSFAIIALLYHDAINTQPIELVWVGGFLVISFDLLQIYWFAYIVKMGQKAVKSMDKADDDKKIE